MQDGIWATCDEGGKKANLLDEMPSSLTECLKALGHMEVAAESYTKVVEMAPLHLEARLSLATLQQQLGRPECALKALESMYDSETLAQDSSAAQKARQRAFSCPPPVENVFFILNI